MELLSPDQVIPLSKLVGKYTQIVKLARDYHNDCPSSGSTAKKNLREKSVLYYLTMLKAELESHGRQ